ncbi:zinc-dependent metalloprotease [Gemmatimonas aurantiaca]|nr:zinc-dependent metalloprotease [Gemmatimonas aurantiaca]
MQTKTQSKKSNKSRLSQLLVMAFVTTTLCFASLQTFAKSKSPDKEPKTISEKTKGMAKAEGLFTYYLDDNSGKIFLEIRALDEEFLYVNSLRTGLGSNPVGLDRGQLGNERIVKFVRYANRIFLMQENLDFRAVTDNADERRAVEESFAKSVLWAGEIVANSGDKVLVDLSNFLLRDAHNVIGRLSAREQGTFTLDKERSVIDFARCKAFPKNIELEALLTFSSKKPGKLVRETTPTPTAVTLWQRHSFIELPDDKYKMRRFDVRAGIFSIAYADYATALDAPLEKRFIVRHRLTKKNSAAELSEALEPIVYYVDRGAPEPVRSALIAGAQWWNQAFEAAGYQNAYRVEVMPEGADPLDVRYNVIQWVHRATRGWSYGGSVIDPRTGEIIKGHVSLGSLRVRQDRLLIEGLSPLFSENNSSQKHMCNFAASPNLDAFAALDPNLGPVDIALMRIRQLAAHEVGHTLGLAHNFAASSYGRESVMDYPAPLAIINTDESLDLSKAYDSGIGEWDKIAMRYAYSEFPSEVDEDSALGAIIDESIERKLLFISDADARSAGSAHPLASLWDNGADPIKELERVMRVRAIALEKFNIESIPIGRPLGELENTLAPLYLSHRFQIAATAKSLGGVLYSYNVRGDAQTNPIPVSADTQRKALGVLIATLLPDALALPSHILQLLPPQPYGYYDDRELFPGRMNTVFDPFALVEISANMTVSAILQRERAARMVYQNQPPFSTALNALIALVGERPNQENGYRSSIRRVVESVVIAKMIQLAGASETSVEVRAITEMGLRNLADRLPQFIIPGKEIDRAHFEALRARISRFLNRSIGDGQEYKNLAAPPGSPIGESAIQR